MWETLSNPWQAALEMAWDAYCSETIPIGAVIVDMDGNVVSRGRNRVNDSTAPKGQVCNDMLAHAEINALLALNMDQDSRHSSALYTTMEPCPLCMGAIYMSSVRTLHFAARDPYAGSSNLLGTTWYLSHKPVKAIGPQNPALEIILMAIHLEFLLTVRGEIELQSNVTQRWQEIVPHGITLGKHLFKSGQLQSMRKNGLGIQEVIEILTYQVQ